MKLKLTRPIVFFDLETTGTDRSKDKIVEISLLKIFPTGEKESYTYLINPEMPIPEEASNVHGITNEDVKNSPTFCQKSEFISQFISGSDLAGFNIDNFDTPILIRQLQECGKSLSSNTRFIDVYKIFINKEPRTLSAAYKYYCGADLDNAHSAEADTLGTFEVLEGMLEKYDDLESNLESLSEFSKFDMETMVDFSGKLIRNENGDIIFNFGKHKGEKVLAHLDYAEWMLNSNFALDTKREIKKILKLV